MAFESEETVFGRVRQCNEQIEYRGVLKVADPGKERVSLELDFVPPHPFVMNMPERVSVEAPSITEVYSKLVRILDEYDVDLECNAEE